MWLGLRASEEPLPSAIGTLLPWRTAAVFVPLAFPLYATRLEWSVLGTPAGAAIVVGFALPAGWGVAYGAWSQGGRCPGILPRFFGGLRSAGVAMTVVLLYLALFGVEVWDTHHYFAGLRAYRLDAVWRGLYPLLALAAAIDLLGGIAQSLSRPRAHEGAAE